MQESMKRTKTAIIALVLVLTIAATFMACVPVAHAADITSVAFISVQPNPVGVGQHVIVNMWLQPFPPSGFKHSGYSLTITKPNGNTESFGPAGSDFSGGWWIWYVPATVGNYSLQFSFAGETLAGNVYKPCTSPIMKLVVQQEPIPSWPAASLPTDYWTRPINSENREWWSISGNWLQANYNATSKFNPYTTLPNTAHIVWTRREREGGLVGGEFGHASFYNNWRMVSPPVIINGLLYYNIVTGQYGGASVLAPGFRCVDLRTGEELWRKNKTITCGQVVERISLNVNGAYAYLWSLGSTYEMYDPLTGDTLVTFTNARTGTVVLDKTGNMLVYVLNTAQGWLALWNSTKALGQTTSWAINWGTKIDWKTGLVWNVTIPKQTYAFSIKSISNDVVFIRSSEAAANTWNAFLGYSAKTGAPMWPLINITGGTVAASAAAEGVFVQYINAELKFHAWDLITGSPLWISDPLDYPWGSYMDNSPMIAYGKLYTGSYAGYMYAIDIKTGKIVWKHRSGNAGYETPYGSWPFFGAPLIADGKVIGVTSEHTPTDPLYRGEGQYVMDAYTGAPIWNISGWWNSGAAADGYYLSINGYDGYLYCFGKGQTSTSVSTSPAVVANGSSVLIQGTVLDQSPGQPGTPCVSAKSMTAWMEYLHMQKPMPIDVTGVPVQLRAMRSDGSMIEIGTVTTDVSGHYEYLWTPPTTDTYKITASFVGDDSYGSSWAETGLGVTAAPPAPTPAPTKDEVANQVISQLPAFTTLDLVIIVAVVIAIIIGLVNLFWKRK